MCGKVNFTGLSRHINMSERTHHRQYGKPFSFISANACLIIQESALKRFQVRHLTVHFSLKSSQLTNGLDWFYNGKVSLSKRGLEISTTAVVDGRFDWLCLEPCWRLAAALPDASVGLSQV